MTVDEYQKSLHAQQPITEEIESTLTKFEAHMASTVHRVEVRGKRGKKVPIFLNKKMKSHVDLVLQLKEELQIESQFVFSTSFVPLRGNDCIRKVALQCGAKKPSLLTSTNLRKQLGTLMQALNLTEDEQDIVAKFMGHDIRIHRQFYRLTNSVLEAAKVTKVLAALNTGRLASMESSWVFARCSSLFGKMLGRKKQTKCLKQPFPEMKVLQNEGNNQENTAIE